MEQNGTESDLRETGSGDGTGPAVLALSGPARSRGLGIAARGLRASGEGWERVYELERHRGSFEIILFLFQNSSCSKSRLRASLKPAQEAIDRSLATLVRLRLAAMNPSPVFPFAKEYRLTERGQQLAISPIYMWPDLLDRF
jgi:DNA-binding HxlR family transcriptional regulator